MKFLVTADWHIKLGQKNVPKDWQINRYRMLFDKINEVECDYHLILGDIFDKIPSLEEIELWFEHVYKSKHKTVWFSGNHEMLTKTKSFLDYLDKVTERINPNFKYVKEPTSLHGVDFLPYSSLKQVKDIKQTSKILCTHVRGEIPPHVKPEIDLDLFNRWDIVLAGDLHSYKNSQRNIMYPGSPMVTSFHRAHTESGYILFDTVSRIPTWHSWKLPQLIRLTVKSAEEMIKTDFDHTIYEVEGNLLELSKVDSNIELLDKKLVKSSAKSTLDFSSLTIQEELALYLTKVLQVPESDVEQILKVFNDSI